MSETVTIQKAFNTGRQSKQGKPFIDVTLADGRKGTATDLTILSHIGKQIALELKEKGEYNGEMTYWVNIPKGQQTPTPKTSDQSTFGLARIEAKLDTIIKHLGIENEPPF
mgnify:CR=1 FL=1